MDGSAEHDVGDRDRVRRQRERLSQRACVIHDREGRVAARNAARELGDASKTKELLEWGLRAEEAHNVPDDVEVATTTGNLANAIGDPAILPR